MEQCWRWFGPNDPVSLDDVRQAGATGIVTALHHLNDGRAWPADEIAKRKAEVAAAGLEWRVIESIIVHEEIKTRTGSFEARIDAYRASLRAAAKAGWPSAFRSLTRLVSRSGQGSLTRRPLPDPGSART
ncbi:MAG: mannonate dehydratase, partial [Pseudomonadota bacterium]